MSVINRRNAFFGWVVYQVGIRVIKQKAKAVVPAIDRVEASEQERDRARRRDGRRCVDVLEEALGRRRLVAG